ncbi:peroxiredoxin [Rhizocola hellebori]|uniref:thioredoxin-dependent peroxiredoxin n=1 Tax=Rhizocola hellebori TaxID=1392758 RepID=A0A8J3Q659_9ACTN|nr:peroxiredoxin [Rhizocola hellebori]GIH04531.1 peroxiredoxin [Rhizocola hellebori]
MAAPQIGLGDQAPDFTLPTQSGTEVTLSDFRDKKTVVLFFYPKDETAGCTAEVCSFRDNYEVFTEAGAEVIGISSDSVSSHERFAGRYSLPFTLVSDEGGEIRKRYGVPSKLGILPGRVTYVIDRSGVVRHVFNSMVNINGHVKGALKIVQELQA